MTWLATLLLSLLSAFVRLWPEPVIAASAWALGGLWFHLLRYRRGVMLDNLAQAFPELSSEARLRLARAACTHLVATLLDFLRIPRHARSGFPTVAAIEGEEHYRAAKALGRGVLVLTGHLGSFELVAAAWAGRSGEPVALVVKSFSPGFDRLVSKIRGSAGLQTIPASKGMGGIKDALKKNDPVVFVLDQNATRRLGVFVDFFGRPASTMTALAILARRTKSPVLPVSIFRDPDGRHRLVIQPVLSEEPAASVNEDVVARTQRYTRFIEQQIRAHPEQWLWTHKRWRTELPPGDSSTRTSEAPDASA